MTSPRKQSTLHHQPPGTVPHGQGQRGFLLQQPQRGGDETANPKSRGKRQFLGLVVQISRWVPIAALISLRAVDNLQPYASSRF